MAEATALLEVTAEEAEETPPAEEEELPEETETEDGPATETESEDPIAALSDDDLRKHPRIGAELKSLEARLNESFRQREENARNQATARAMEEKNSRELEALRGDVGRQYVSSAADLIAKRVTERFTAWAKNPENQDDFTVTQADIAEAISGSLGTVASSLVANSLDQAQKVFEEFRKKEYPDYKPEEDLLRVQTQASLKRDLPTLYAANVALMLKADRASYETKVRQDERERVLAEQRKDEQAIKTEKKAEANQARPRPTVVNGASGNPDLKFTLEEINGMSTSEWMATSSDRLQRQRWLDAAHADADRRARNGSLARR